MKRLAGLVCLAVLMVSCGGESADVSAPAAAVEPATPLGLVSRDDLVITAPTVLWFWAPG